MKAFGFDGDSVYPIEELEKDYDYWYPNAFVWATKFLAVIKSTLSSTISVITFLFLQHHLKSDKEFDLKDTKNVASEDDMKKSMEKTKAASIEQATSNQGYREETLSLVREADSRNMFERQ